MVGVRTKLEFKEHITLSAICTVQLVLYPELTTSPGERRSGKLRTIFLAYGLECRTANQIQANAIKIQSHMTTELLISNGLHPVHMYVYLNVYQD